MQSVSYWHTNVSYTYLYYFIGSIYSSNNKAIKINSFAIIFDGT